MLSTIATVRIMAVRVPILSTTASTATTTTILSATMHRMAVRMPVLVMVCVVVVHVDVLLLVIKFIVVVVVVDAGVLPLVLSVIVLRPRRVARPALVLDIVGNVQSASATRPIRRVATAAALGLLDEVHRVR